MRSRFDFLYRKLQYFCNLPFESTIQADQQLAYLGGEDD
jgi:hypothetical protein